MNLTYILRIARERAELEEIRVQMLQDIEKKLTTDAKNIAERTEEVKEMIVRFHMPKIESWDVSPGNWWLIYFQQLSEDFVTTENLEQKIRKALESPTVYEYAIDLEARKVPSPTPVKYTEGIPTRQKGRLYDRSHAQTLQAHVKR